MNTQTPKRVAFEEVTHALAEIDQYNISKKFEHLERADSALALARNEDSDYVDALLYSGMVCDQPSFERRLCQCQEVSAEKLTDIWSVCRQVKSSYIRFLDLQTKAGHTFSPYRLCIIALFR